MNVVLDTNVLASAFLTPDGKSAAILRLALRGDFQICLNMAILAEYEEVLARPKFAGKIHQSAIRRFIELLNDIGTKTVGIPSATPLPDESDRKFYDAAKSANAVLVTGNKKHYPDEPVIIDPSEFLQSLL